MGLAFFSIFLAQHDYKTNFEELKNINKKSKTILTSTNLTPKALEIKYDERTLDRLRRCKVVKFEGESLRAK